MKTIRRKLLKGSLAAPLLLTVQSARAHANKSAALVCVGRDQRRSEHWPRPKELARIDDDDWLRINVDVCELYRYKQVHGMERIEGKYFLGADQEHYWRIEEGGPHGLHARKTEYTVHKVVARQTGEFKRALVHMGPDGPTGYAWERGGGHPMSKSCWHSFKMMSKPRWWRG